MTNRAVATEPNDLGRYFIERGKAGDVDGLVALYEPDAVLAFPPGDLSKGHAEIRQVYERFVAAAPELEPGRQHPALVSGDLALTVSTLTTGEMAVEVARRQEDGTWLWVVDQPVLLPDNG
nr:nuclear transport factor 2 family protein [Actinoalloteichus spitiensis]